MNPLCKCSHGRDEHATGSGLEPCKPSCGCLEWRLDPRSPLMPETAGEDATEAEGAA